MGQIDTIKVDGTNYDVADKRLTECAVASNGKFFLAATDSDNPEISRMSHEDAAKAVGGNQNGNADGFVKFINTYIDDTIDDIRPNGIYPLAGETPTDRGFVFRFYSDKHTRAFEIRVCEKSGMSYRSKMGASEWGAWKSVGETSMGVLSKSEDLNNVKNTGVYVLYTEQHPSNTPSGLLSTTTSLLKVTDGGPVLIQEIYPLAGEPFYRLYYKNNFTWYDWTSLSTGIPSFYKNYPDIASLARGLNKTIKTNGGEHIYKIGSINSNYTPFITRIFVSNTDSNSLTEYVAVVGESTSGIAADGNKVYYRLLAGALHAGKIEIKVAGRTIYAVTTGDIAVRFESATEVTGIDLSTAYDVPLQQIN